ncbi:MAG: hypothetical protein IJ783_03410 [Kiritimatiellae bacterium]|nr:hypothetical protein [Kiritimatiellia bacterium]
MSSDADLYDGFSTTRRASSSVFHSHDRLSQQYVKLPALPWNNSVQSDVAMSSARLGTRRPSSTRVQ